jgi:hypothetical protein
VRLDVDVAGRAVTPELRVRLYDGSRRGRETGSSVHRPDRGCCQLSH